MRSGFIAASIALCAAIGVGLTVATGGSGAWSVADFALVFAAVLLAAVLATVMLIRLARRRVATIVAGIKRLSDGQFATRFDTAQAGDELTVLDTSLNDLARRLDGRLAEVARANRRLDVVLGSMLDGVVVFDPELIVRSVNDAAQSLLELPERTPVGAALDHIIRDPELRRGIRETARIGTPTRIEVTAGEDRGRALEAHATRFPDEADHRGVLLVIHDVTQMKRLEQVRRDFVANVSHELRTPITSIKGFVETIIDKGMLGGGEASRFLTIISGQADRLNAIVEDLMSLSRIEQAEEHEGISLDQASIAAILNDAVQTCALSANERGLSVRIDCPDELTARCNAALLEQAVVNLVDNAIRYSPAGSEVIIVARHTPDCLTVTVRDHGVGIGSEHLPRLFERFYRVERGRNAKSGTGLGLAIVKHIATAHGGAVTVDSTPGEGSAFTMTVPNST